MTEYLTNLMILLNDFIGAALGFSEKSLRAWDFPSIPSGVQLPAPYGNGSSVHGLLITNQTCVFLSVSASPLVISMLQAHLTTSFILCFSFFFFFLCVRLVSAKHISHSSTGWEQRGGGSMTSRTGPRECCTNILRSCEGIGMELRSPVGVNTFF